MASDKIIYYDSEFIAGFEKLKEMLEAEDWPALHAFLIEKYDRIFKLAQYYGQYFAGGSAPDFEEADDDIKKELMRPLSHRQYRMVERSFSVWQHETDLVLWSIWDFLHDNGRIYEKKVMSPAEVGCCSLVLENVYRCLSRLENPHYNKKSRKKKKEE